MTPGTLTDRGYEHIVYALRGQEYNLQAFHKMRIGGTNILHGSTTMKREQNSASSPTMSASSPHREQSGSASGDTEEKPRLSEKEKKANHIASGIAP